MKWNVSNGNRDVPQRGSAQERTWNLRGQGCFQKKDWGSQTLQGLPKQRWTLWGWPASTHWWQQAIKALSSTGPHCSTIYGLPCPMWWLMLSGLPVIVFPLAEVTDGCPVQKLHLNDGLRGSTCNTRHHTDEHRSLHVNAELSCSLYRKLGPVLRKSYLYGILLRNKTFKSLEKRKATFVYAWCFSGFTETLYQDNEFSDTGEV